MEECLKRKEVSENMNTRTLAKHIASFMVVAVLAAPAVAGAAGWNVGDYTGHGIAEGSVSGIITTILNWLLYILGFLAIIGFVVSGIMYIVSAGNEDLAEKAKSGMINSIIGVIVALLGFVVIKAVTALLVNSGSGTGV